MMNMSKLKAIAAHNAAKSKAAHEQARLAEESRRETAAAHTVESVFDVKPRSDLRCLGLYARSFRQFQNAGVRDLCA